MRLTKIRNDPNRILPNLYPEMFPNGRLNDSMEQAMLGHQRMGLDQQQNPRRPNRNNTVNNEPPPVVPIQARPMQAQATTQNNIDQNNDESSESYEVVSFDSDEESNSPAPNQQVTGKPVKVQKTNVHFKQKKANGDIDFSVIDLQNNIISVTNVSDVKGSDGEVYKGPMPAMPRVPIKNLKDA